MTRLLRRVAWLRLGIGAAHAASCPAGIGAAPGPVPPALTAEYLKAFNVPAAYAEPAGLVRCASGRVLACSFGANLPCGKADTRRLMPAADAWCGAHSGSDFIPAFVTGHATIFAWHCQGRRAAILRQIAHVDAQGYVAEYWRELE